MIGADHSRPSMSADEIIAIVQAHKDGAEIQQLYLIIPTDWADCPTPFWDFAEYRYRIAPPKPREFTLRFCSAEDSTHAWVVNPNGGDCQHCERIRVREVLP